MNLVARTLSQLHRAYRASGADLPFGDPLQAHGVAMEGYFWRFTSGRRSVIALIGVNRSAQGHWATLGLASAGGAAPTLQVMAADEGWADPEDLGARSGRRFVADRSRVSVDLGPRARLDVRISDHLPWPHRAFGGSSGFQSLPALNQYWHPWLLGGRATGYAVLGEERWQLDGVQVYAEKNWGKGGFPQSWWWGQAHGFAEPEACVAFAGGQVNTGVLRAEVTALVVRLPSGQVLRLGNPGTSPVKARIGRDTWHLVGRMRRWTVQISAQAPLGQSHVLPVPLPAEHRQVPGALEHLAGHLDVVVRHGGSTVWQGSSSVAGLEHGGLTLAAEEVARRGELPTPP